MSAQAATAGLALAVRASIAATNAPGFERGVVEYQLGASISNSFNTDEGRERPHIRDAAGHFRVGWMLGRPRGRGAFRGNWELVSEATLCRVLDGPGTSLNGLSLYLRYNCLPSASNQTVYVQFGFGGVENDIFEDNRQTIIGQRFEFRWFAGIGARFATGPNSGWYLETGWRHVSNGDQADRNFGLNSVSVQLGLSWRS